MDAMPKGKARPAQQQPGTRNERIKVKVLRGTAKARGQFIRPKGRYMNSAAANAISQAEHEDNIAIATLVVERKRNLREEDVVSHDEMLKRLGVDPSELR